VALVSGRTLVRIFRGGARRSQMVKRLICHSGCPLLRSSPSEMEPPWVAGRQPRPSGESMFPWRVPCKVLSGEMTLGEVAPGSADILWILDALRGDPIVAVSTISLRSSLVGLSCLERALTGE
jgi:hypothetical protein